MEGCEEMKKINDEEGAYFPETEKYISKAKKFLETLKHDLK